MYELMVSSASEEFSNPFLNGVAWDFTDHLAAIPITTFCFLIE